MSKRVLESCSSKSCAKIDQLQKIWNEVQHHSLVTEHKEKKKVLQDTGALLALSKEAVQQIWDLIEGTNDKLDLNMKVSKGHFRLIEDLLERMRTRPSDHLSKVKSVHKEILTWKSDTAKNPYYQDVARMMQIPDTMLVELSARLAEMSKHKRNKEEEDAAAAAASEAMAPIKKYDKATRSR